MDEALTPSADAGWVLVGDGADVLRESSRESRFSISNGFLGVRGAQAINLASSWAPPPRTYLAGLFDASGAAGFAPTLAPAPNWLRVGISVRGLSSAGRSLEAPPERLTLDMRRGVLLGDFGHAAGEGLPGLRARALRLVSLSERAIGLQLIELEAWAEEVEITLEAGFAGVNLGLTLERMDADLGIWRTQHSGQSVAIAAAAALRIDGEIVTPTRRGALQWSWTWRSAPGQVACFERLVAIQRGEAGGVGPGAGALATLGGAQRVGWRGVLAGHEAAWSDRWALGGVDVRGDGAAQTALRFAVYHLTGAPDPTCDRVSIGARALTGDDYGGHVFWDTEIFLLPFYTYTWPAAARALLMYRFHTLGAARAKAAALGWRGALYAWESADTGAEATPDQVVGPDRQVIDVLCGKQEQHISADIAYAVWQYWQVTGDDPFLIEAGAEILLETARFWVSRAALEGDGQRHIRGVIGPDEYHMTIDDNAFTNVMARWNLRRAIEVAAVMRELWPADWTRLSARLGLTEDELGDWKGVADTLVSGFDPKTGLYEQFEGYFALEDIDLADYAGRSVPMDVVLGRARTQQSQVIKQADVVALLALLPEEFPPGAAATNFDHYARRCGHGSSLSRALHGLAAARLGRAEEALGFFRQSAGIDLADAHVAIAGGVHIAALGGDWQMAVLGFGGLSPLPGGVALNPRLPASWESLAFAFQWRGRGLRIRIDQAQDVVDATLLAGEPMTLTVAGTPHALAAGLTIRVAAGAQTPCPASIIA
jgi:trehalose/maltose hydrolase-like predicted phosphorylase